MYSQYRNLCGASEGRRLRQASRLSLPGETPLYGLAIYDRSSISRTERIKDNVRLGGRDARKVVPFTLMLEGSVRWIQDFKSAVAALPYGVTKFSRGLWPWCLAKFSTNALAIAARLLLRTPVVGVLVGKQKACSVATTHDHPLWTLCRAHVRKHRDSLLYGCCIALVVVGTLGDGGLKDE